MQQELIPSVFETELIVSPALLMGGMVISSPQATTHKQLEAALGNLDFRVRVGILQGYLTSLGRFLNREEALKLAISAGQVEAGKFPPLLSREDLTNQPLNQA